MWTVVDAFVLSGVVVALYGLWEYASGDVITAEGGLLRLRSVFGSPNNVALYLGRLIPLLVAMVLLGRKGERMGNLRLPDEGGGVRSGWRWWAYGLALLPAGVAMALTFSKGGLFLGLPAGLLVVFWLWQRHNGRRSWPWVVAAGILGIALIMVISLVPALAGRLGLFGATGVFRLNLWQASLNMFLDHPLWGVGLDNFLYEYRGRYIFDAAWQEPNLNHPHNIFLDFATRLGIVGVLAGGWMIWEAVRALRAAVGRLTAKAATTNDTNDANEWLPVAVGFSGALAAMVAHGLVDHSFFLVDLAFLFYLILGTAVWLMKDEGRRMEDEK
jgi:O-antigen ligase